MRRKTFPKRSIVAVGVIVLAACAALLGVWHGRRAEVSEEAAETSVFVRSSAPAGLPKGLARAARSNRSNGEFADSVGA